MLQVLATNWHEIYHTLPPGQRAVILKEHVLLEVYKGLKLVEKDSVRFTMNFNQWNTHTLKTDPKEDEDKHYEIGFDVDFHQDCDGKQAAR